MKIFVLWFNEWERSDVLGVFTSLKTAENWKAYFIKYPFENYGFGAPDFKSYAERDDFTDRFQIVEQELGKISPNIEVSNLKYLEMKFEEGAE